jgi:F-type H+-transporting ATPase subunit b
MEQTLHALAGILQKSIPTILFLILLLFYFKAMLFGPLAKTLAQRDQLTKGARKTARHSLEEADRKTTEFEAKLRDARGEVYREQEETRKNWLADQAVQVASARESSAQSIQKAKEQIAVEVATARTSVSEQAGALADQITSQVLQRRAG